MPSQFDVTPVQPGNAAAEIFKLMAQMPNQNKAALEYQKAKNDELKAQREYRKEQSDFALNLLSGVNSEEDLAIAKRQYASRYPESADKIDQMLPTYDPSTIKLLRNSLVDEKTRLAREDKANELKSYAPGSALYRGDKQVGSVPTKGDYDVFTDETGKNQVYIQKGSPIPAGYTKVTGKGSSININTGSDSLTKPTKTQLEKDIIEGTKNISSFKKTEELFKPEYLTVMGKGEKVTSEVMDKMGLSTGDQKKFITERQNWFRRAKADFIAYRKWATGVAGGPQELAEIATSFPDPVKNSPTQYKANLDSIEETTKEILLLNREFLDSGINIDQPFGKLMEEVKAKTNIDVPPMEGGTVTLRFDKEGNLIDGD